MHAPARLQLGPSKRTQTYFVDLRFAQVAEVRQLGQQPQRAQPRCIRASTGKGVGRAGKEAAGYRHSAAGGDEILRTAGNARGEQ